MQTFLPYANISLSVDVLDTARLNKQIQETTVILGTLVGWYKKGFPHHPATKMWARYEFYLFRYGIACLNRFSTITKKDQSPRYLKLLQMHDMIPESSTKRPPYWFGWPRLHSVYRGVLLHKNYGYYSQFGWDETPIQPNGNGSYPYIWPTKVVGENVIFNKHVNL